MCACVLLVCFLLLRYSVCACDLCMFVVVYVVVWGVLFFFVWVCLCPLFVWVLKRASVLFFVV